jgi:hypothetical protein
MCECITPGQVDTAEEEDAFLAVATAAVSVLVLGLETRLGAHLALLMRTNWATLESVQPLYNNHVYLVLFPTPWLSQQFESRWAQEPWTSCDGLLSEDLTSQCRIVSLIPLNITSVRLHVIATHTQADPNTHTTKPSSLLFRTLRR